jgi:hypothetical protein
VSFTVLYTAWLFVIAIPGTAFYIWSLATDTSVDNLLTAIYALLMTIWVTVVHENWKRRQNELAQVWNSKEANQRTITRPEYIGNYTIDPTTKAVVKKARLSPTKKRMFVT